MSERISHPGEKMLLSWPGFGSVPRYPDVTSAEDLYTLVCAQIDRPVDIVAQSMGGVFALRAALDHPERVRHVVLAATSGGVAAVRNLAQHDWRQDWLREYPQSPRWFVDDETDLTERLPALRTPVLLLLGSADPVSPIAAGRALQKLLSASELIVVEGGGHDFGRERRDEVSELIEAFLAK